MVGMIVGQIGSWTSVGELLTAYPYLEREDVLRAIRYAALLAQGRDVVPAECETVGFARCPHLRLEIWAPALAGFTYGPPPISCRTAYSGVATLLRAPLYA